VPFCCGPDPGDCPVKRSSCYVVDPGTASSRIGALGSFKVNDDFTAGTRLEFDYDHNRSSSVNQENKNNVGDGKFRDRWVDLQLTSKRLGKLFIGKGSTASIIVKFHLFHICSLPKH